MATLKQTYIALSRLFPQSMLPGLQKLLTYAGIDEDLEIWTGRSMLVSLLFSIAGFMAPLTFLRYDPMLDISFLPLSQVIMRFSVPFFFIALMLSAALYYVYLFYRMQGRTDAIEKVLPDFLLIVVSNLHAGMSPFAAFVGAARPEFGPLEEEVKKVAARTSSSESLTTALLELSDRVNSSIFQKTIVFFEKAVRSGGQMAKILHATADEIRHIQELRQELVSQTRSYVIFIGFIIVFIAPFLLSVSNQFLSIFIRIKSQTLGGAASSFNISMFQGEMTVTPEFVENISVVFLFCASFLISLFLGTIVRGKPLYGIKYFPVLAVLTFVVYSIAKSMIGGLLSAFA